MQEPKKVTINAVYAKDLAELLDSFGLLSAIQGGQRHCDICEKEVLSLKNIGAMYWEDNNLRIACDNPVCYHDALEKDKT